MNNKDPNIVMIWSSIIDLDDWKDTIKEEILEFDRFDTRDEAAERAWDEKEKANQDKYDNMPHKQYLTERKEFIENFEYTLSDEELDEFIDDRYDEILEYVTDLNNEYLNDDKGYTLPSGEKIVGNLDCPVSGEILCIGERNLWNGTAFEISKVQGNNLTDCLSSRTRGTDDVEFYVEKDTLELKQNDYHHDGTNHFTYREVKAGVTEEQLDEFFAKCSAGKITRADIDKITEPMGRYVQRIYGFEVNKPEKKKADIEKD